MTQRLRFNLRVVSLLMPLLMISCTKDAGEGGEPDSSMTIAEMLAEQEAAALPSLGAGQGRFDVFETYIATIHSYTAPEDGQLVTSHIVETDNALVLIDAQFLVPYAQQLKDYVETLGKPLERIYITNDQASRWAGAETFGDVPVHAQEVIAQQISARGDAMLQGLRADFGELVPEQPVVIDQTTQVHSDIFDGLTYEFELVQNGDTWMQTLIRLPDIDVAFVQDMVSSNAHIRLAGADLQTWIRNLAVFSVDAQSSQIFVGYGYPARVDAQQVGKQISYLQTAKNFAEDNQIIVSGEALEALEMAYPDYGATYLLQGAED